MWNIQMYSFKKTQLMIMITSWQGNHFTPCWSFGRGMHPWLMNSPHKGPELWSCENGTYDLLPWSIVWALLWLMKKPRRFFITQPQVNENISDVTWIKVMSHERHNLSNYLQLDCLFNRLFRLTVAKETPKTLVTHAPQLVGDCLAT